jgi:hypothetical protein
MSKLFKIYPSKKLLKMVEVFKTDIQTDSQANFLLQQLLKEFPDLKINFDLEDCDNILRIETRGKAIDTALIVDLVKNYGFEIEILPDVVPRQTREGYAGASKFRTYLWIGIAVFLLNGCGTTKKNGLY